MDFLKKIFGIERKRALETYRKGIQHFNRLQYDKAIEMFERALDEKSLAHSLETKLARFYCGRSYINMGITLFAKQQSKEALDYFQKARSMNPDDTDLSYFIGICYNNIGAYEQAMETFSKILETEPWNIPTKLKIAIIFHNMKMWESAENIHREILKKHPGFADVHFHLGLALMSQAKPAEAAEAFSNALSINPNYIEARLKLAMVQICMNQTLKALENLELIARQHPEYADVHYLLAIVKEKDGHHTQAVRHLQAALDISPQFKNAQVKLIIAYGRTGNHSAAAKQVSEALSFYPEDNRIMAIQKALKVFDPDFSVPKDTIEDQDVISLEDEHLIKELRHEFHKDLDIMPNVSEIISMFSNSRYTHEDSSLKEFLIPFITEQINRNPTYPDLYNSLGSQLLSSQKYMEAETAFSKALELNPDYVAARINLMKTFFRSGKDNEALVHGNLLLAKDLPFPDVYYTLAEILINLKEYDKALINANRALRLRPGLNKARLLLAKIYIGQQNQTAAIKMLRVFLEGQTDPPSEREAKSLLTSLEADMSGF